MFPNPDAPLAVLISGGLDSAILLGEALQHQRTVHPLYVRNGLYWEPVELEHLRRFLSAVAGPTLQPLQILDLPVADLYAEHWSITGRGVPQAGSPDEAVFLPGRNVLLLAKTILWCHLHGVPAVALACLATNPFPDATAAFFHDYQQAVNAAVHGSVAVQTPYAGSSKTAVMLRGRALPLHLTFSCIRPVNGLHCGRCNKCAERRQAFADADLADETPYA
jgi:7-cyano-7-deazaguanine synthase